MAQKYPDASTRPEFDEDVWTISSGGPKKSYVKGLGKRPRGASITSTSGGSACGSSATSAPPSLPDPEAYLKECVSRLTPEQIQTIFSDLLRANSSQGSAASEVILLPFFYVFKLAFMLLFLLRGKLVIN